MGDQKKESESGSLFEDKDLWLLFKDGDKKKTPGDLLPRARFEGNFPPREAIQSK